MILSDLIHARRRTQSQLAETYEFWCLFEPVLHPEALRQNHKKSEQFLNQLRSPSCIVLYMVPVVSPLGQECFWTVLLHHRSSSVTTGSILCDCRSLWRCWRLGEQWRVFRDISRKLHLCRPKLETNSWGLVSGESIVGVYDITLLLCKSVYEVTL